VTAGASGQGDMGQQVTTVTDENVTGDAMVLGGTKRLTSSYGDSAGTFTSLFQKDENFVTFPTQSETYEKQT
jgi:hypothetical protein